MKEKGKKLTKRIIFAIVCAAITGTIALACAGLQIAFVIADKIECAYPDYEKADETAMSEILDKDALTGQDYTL